MASNPRMGDLHVLSLFCLAVAQPLLDVLSKNAQFFVARGSGPRDVYLLVAIICILVPGFLILMKRLLDFFYPRIAQVFQGGILWFLLFLILLQLEKKLIGSDFIIVLTGSLIASFLLFCYYRTKALPLFATYLSPAILLVPVLFLTNGAVRNVLRSENSQLQGLPVDSKIPIVILVLDELPLGSILDDSMHIDAKWFPNLARVEQRSTWFRNASAASDVTDCAVPAIITGLYPRHRKLATNVEYPRNLFSLLTASYQMHVVESDTRFSPETVIADATKDLNLQQRISSLLMDVAAVYLQIVLPHQYALAFPSLGGTWRDFWQTEANKSTKERRTRGKQFAEFILNIHHTDSAVLHFLHIELPHGPWSYFATGTEYNYGRWKSPLAKEETLQGWGRDKSVSDRAFQRYMLQLIYTDRLLGKLIDRLEQEQLWNRCLFILVADHGISFDPADSSHRSVNKSNFVDLLSVPLFIKMPNQTVGRIDDRKAETIDVVPTVAEIVGSQTKWNWDGESLLGLPKRNIRRTMSWSLTEGKFLSFPSFSFQQSKTLALKRQLFGALTGEEAIFRYGPVPELHGQPTAHIQQNADGALSAEIYNRQWIEHVDLSTGFVPALVTGKIHKPAALKTPLKVALGFNGTIRGTVSTFAVDAATEAFALLVPENSFQQGKNVVEVFQISGQNLLRMKTGWIP
jgi:arylsulfatase A-like enzyme